MFGTDSGLRTLIAVASLVARTGKPLSRIIAPFRRYAHSGEINFENADKEGALAALRKSYPKAKVATLDGISLDAGDWWCNVRMSNTEPLLRLNLESADAATTERMVKEVSRFLGKRVAH
jgi:phosphomannomutase